jgi:hypothetical protein
MANERRLHRGISFDYKTDEYVITDEYKSGYVVLGRFATEAAAKQAIKMMDGQWTPESARRRVGGTFGS